MKWGRREALLKTRPLVGHPSGQSSLIPQGLSEKTYISCTSELPSASSLHKQGCPMDVKTSMHFQDAHPQGLGIPTAIPHPTRGVKAAPGQKGRCRAAETGATVLAGAEMAEETWAVGWPCTLSRSLDYAWFFCPSCCCC